MKIAHKIGYKFQSTPLRFSGHQHMQKCPRVLVSVTKDPTQIPEPTPQIPEPTPTQTPEPTPTQIPEPTLSQRFHKKDF